MKFINEYAWVIFIGLGTVVLFLGIYLGYLWRQLDLQKKETEKRKAESFQNKKEKDKYVVDSLDIIALATIQNQCDASECCIRVKNLIDYFPELSAKTELQVFHQMYEEIKDFPTHEKRKEQSKQKTFEQDKRRFRIEDKYRDRLLKSLETLREELKSYQ
ncbi:MAG: hypothetical protein CME65_13665 [Halobacteriovoraceae bacterium]|nr:hypothetical protein [Halobacteriovoraceae bacterium]|tara:strand:+ start:3967 stop:4446 length:480 start_codon:yes stop_codon:yes gene_type:complete